MTQPTTDLGRYIQGNSESGHLVVQPRMGMPDPVLMAAGLKAVAMAGPKTVGTITLDSYTRTGDHLAARRALAGSEDLNGFPLVAHGPDVVARVAGAANQVPVQVRHGSAVPLAIFDTMVKAGLTASEGGPVSYCLPYGRTPLAESIAAWRDAAQYLGDECRYRGGRAHLETFGGCLLGQLCPPSLLVAMSILEAMFFVQQGIESVSLSYAQQTDAVQDVEALTALRILAGELLPTQIDRHIVYYTYMGVFPHTDRGAQLLMDSSVEIAIRGEAERVIVKTIAEAHRIPTVEENIDALRRANAVARWARTGSSLPSARQVSPDAILAEARALIEPVLGFGDIGKGLLHSFRRGLLDVPFCLHADNRNLTQGVIAENGRLEWGRAGLLPIAPRTTSRGTLRASELMRMLYRTAEVNDRKGLGSGQPSDIENVIAQYIER